MNNFSKFFFRIFLLILFLLSDLIARGGRGSGDNVRGGGSIGRSNANRTYANSNTRKNVIESDEEESVSEQEEGDLSQEDLPNSIQKNTKLKNDSKQKFKVLKNKFKNIIRRQVANYEPGRNENSGEIQNSQINYNPKDELTDIDCIICFCAIEKFPKKLSCGHNQFHSKCFATWLKEQATCPLCRHEL